MPPLELDRDDALREATRVVLLFERLPVFVCVPEPELLWLSPLPSTRTVVEASDLAPPGVIGFFAWFAPAILIVWIWRSAALIQPAGLVSSPRKPNAFAVIMLDFLLSNVSERLWRFLINFSLLGSGSPLASNCDTYQTGRGGLRCPLDM